MAISLFNRMATDVVALSPEVRRSRAFIEDRLIKARKSPHGIYLEVGARLTPELAEEFLSKNPQNRRVVRVHLEKIKRDIVSGAFEHNHEDMAISPDGELVTGQHRCLAVVETQCPIVTDIKFGVPMRHRDTWDQGARKTTGDCLQMKGIANGDTKAAAANLILQYLNARYVSQASRSASTRTNWNLSRQIHRWGSS